MTGRGGGSSVNININKRGADNLFIFTHFTLPLFSLSFVAWIHVPALVGTPRCWVQTSYVYWQSLIPITHMTGLLRSIEGYEVKSRPVG